MTNPTPTTLFEDIKSVDSLGKALALSDDNSMPALAGVAAMERGTRELTDGTIERYERLEFR